MKKLTMMLAVMALLMAFPAAAGAKKPVLEGHTCAQYQKLFDDPSLWQVGVFPITYPDDPTDIVDCSNEDGPCFSVTLTPNQPAACIDVTSDAGNWGITLEPVEVAALYMQIKDSVPGDFCFREGWEEKKNTIPDSPWVIDVWIPAATIDGCTPGEVGLAADLEDPLVFMVSYTPERKSDSSGVEIKVDLP